jgi:predicted HD superfamily hydrolase involved in NAD metabolism
MMIDDAAEGRLPGWAVVSRRRLEHMERVAALLGEWAAALELPPAEQRRWQATGYLHDALREAPPDELRPLVPAVFRHLSGKLLHGPAAAEKLRQEGVEDESMLRAITYHTIGHPELDDLGRALFIADYIEPGRKHEPAGLAALRARMPAALEAVLREVVQARVEGLLREGRPIRSETAAFWNAVNGGQARARDAAAP